MCYDNENLDKLINGEKSQKLKEVLFTYLLVKSPCVARFYVKIYRIYNYYTKLVIIKRKE